MTVALRSETREVLPDEAGLERLLGEGRKFSAEFPDFLANHLPMVLVAMHRLGGSDARLREYFATYRDANGLVPPPAQVAAVERANWAAALGARERETDYRVFFDEEVQRLGAQRAI